MKLAWLVQEYEEYPDDIKVVFTEPTVWYFKITPIVYAELES